MCQIELYIMWYAGSVIWHKHLTDFSRDLFRSGLSYLCNAIPSTIPAKKKKKRNVGVVCCWGTCPTLFNICIPTFTIRSLQFHKAQRKTFFNLEKFFYFLEVRTCSNQRHVCMLSTCEGHIHIYSSPATVVVLLCCEWRRTSNWHPYWWPVPGHSYD